jgi:hypothetical protein
VSNPKGESVAPKFRRQPDGGGLVNEDALRKICQKLANRR